MNLGSDTPTLTECFKAASDEFLQRIRYREFYVRLQLLIQAILACAAEGIAVAGVKAETPTHYVLLLAVPIAWTLAMLHLFEDVVARHLAKYLAKLSPQSWFASTQLSDLYRDHAWYRLVAQLISFVVTPAALLSRYLMSSGFSVMSMTVVVVEALFLVGLVTIFGFEWRRKWPTRKQTVEPPDDASTNT